MIRTGKSDIFKNMNKLYTSAALSNIQYINCSILKAIFMRKLFSYSPRNQGELRGVTNIKQNGTVK